MRGLALFFALSALGWGQTLSGLFGPQFERIVPYLGLTKGQLDQILQRGDDFLVWELGRQERVYDLQTEIAVEKARSPLDPMALGVRYVEMETIRREIAARRAELVPGNVALLTEEQRGKLGPLEAAMRLRPTWTQLEPLGLVAGQCRTAEECASGRFPERTPIGVDNLPEALARAYLGLSEEQVMVLRARKRQLGEWLGARYERVIVLDREIALETKRSPLVPLALGERYAELETIRREMGERWSAMVAENVAVLTEAQRGRLAELEAAMRLAEVGDEARVLQVLAPDCTGRYFAALLLGQVGGVDSWCETAAFVQVP